MIGGKPTTHEALNHANPPMVCCVILTDRAKTTCRNGNEQHSNPAAIEADDRHAARTQGPGQEIRQQPGLKPGSDDTGRMPTNCPGNGIGIGGAFASPDHGALLINHADRGQLLRNIQTYIGSMGFSCWRHATGEPNPSGDYPDVPASLSLCRLKCEHFCWRFKPRLLPLNCEYVVRNTNLIGVLPLT